MSKRKNPKIDHALIQSRVNLIFFFLKFKTLIRLKQQILYFSFKKCIRKGFFEIPHPLQKRMKFIKFTLPLLPYFRWMFLRHVKCYEWMDRFDRIYQSSIWSRRLIYFSILKAICGCIHRDCWVKWSQT